MRVFITGATGYIGNAVARELASAGHEVTGLVRSPEKARELESVGARGVVGDLKDPASYKDAAREAEAIVHAAFEYSDRGVEADRTAVEALLEAAREAGGKRSVIYTSGVWVLGNTGDRPAFEDASTEHPATVSAWRVGHEERVLRHGTPELAVAVIRPGIVWGGRGGIVASYFEAAEKEGAVRIVGEGRNRVPHIHRDDLARHYRAVLERRGTGVFHAVDGLAPQLGDVARALSKAAGKGGAVTSVPPEEARESMGLMAEALILDQVVESRRNLEIDWVPERGGIVQEAEAAYREWSGGG